MARTATLINYLFLGFFIQVIGILSTANAAPVFVPAGGSIQAAIDDPCVVAGDTITVAGDPIVPIVFTGPGNYNIDFKGKNVMLQSQWGAAGTIIDCQYRGRGFIFKSGETTSALLDGFTIRYGYARSSDPCNWPMVPNDDPDAYGGAIYCKNSSPWIRNCIIEINYADSGGGAIFCDDNANALITNCDISYNYAGFGFDIYNLDPNDFNDVNNLNITQLGGGIYCRDSNPMIIWATMTWNLVSGSGGGIACENSNATIRDCIIYENDCWVNHDGINQHGGGIYCRRGKPKIERGTVTWNFANWSGGGIAVVDGNGILLDDVNIIDNHCLASGGGIYSEGHPSSDPNDANTPNCFIKNCHITNNVGHWSGGVSSSYGSVVDIDLCTIAYNIVGWTWLVGGVEAYYGQANITNCMIWGNKGVQVSKVAAAASTMGLTGLEMAGGGASNASINVTYSNVEMTDPASVWPGEGNINKDPLFVNPRPPYDYRLQNTDPNNTSPCINAGDPFADYSLEPMPNGGRINMGAFGGTEHASTSDILRPVPADINADLKVNMADFAIFSNNWLLEGANIKNKKADADNNGVVNKRDLAILKKFWLWLQ